MLADPESATKAEVEVTEIVKAAGNDHALGQRLRLLGDGSAAPSQAGEAQPEGSIEALNVGGVDDARLLLSRLTESLDLLRTALDQPPLNLQALSRAPLDDLDNGNIRPSHQPGPADLSNSRQWGAKSMAERLDIAGQAIYRQQQWPA
jgi:hypothetical protein